MAPPCTRSSCPDSARSVRSRRIVCGVKVGDAVTRGGRFGMIKFGSRSELYLPLEAGFEAAVQVGDKVFAGLSVLMRPADTDSVEAKAAQEAGA